MRAWPVRYSAMADKPSRTVSGEVLVTAETIETASRRALVEIRRREGRRGRPAQLLSISLHIARGGSLDRDVADRLSPRAEATA